MDLDKIKEKISKPLLEENINIVNIEYVNENNHNFLRVIIDKVNGVDVETAVKATKIIKPIIDKLDNTDEDYLLEVSSKEGGK